MMRRDSLKQDLRSSTTAGWGGGGTAPHLLTQCSHAGCGKNSYALKQSGIILKRGGNARMMCLDCLQVGRGRCCFCCSCVVLLTAGVGTTRSQKASATASCDCCCVLLRVLSGSGFEHPRRCSRDFQAKTAFSYNGATSMLVALSLDLPGLFGGSSSLYSLCSVLGGTNQVYACASAQSSSDLHMANLLEYVRCNACLR